MAKVERKLRHLQCSSSSNCSIDVPSMASGLTCNGVEHAHRAVAREVLFISCMKARHAAAPASNLLLFRLASPDCCLLHVLDLLAMLSRQAGGKAAGRAIPTGQQKRM